MNKQQFLETIRRSIGHLPAREAEQSLEYYAEMIDDYVENGMTEEQAVEAIGSPEDIAARIIDDIGCAAEQEPEQTFSADTCVVDRFFDSVSINAVEHDIILRPSQDDKCRVQCDSADKYITVRVHRNTLVITRKRRRKSFSFISDSSLTVYLPHREYISAKLETVSGDIDVPSQCVFAGAHLSSISGDIEYFSRTTAGMSAKSTSGDIRISDAHGKLVSITTVSGDIELDHSTADSLHITSVSGDVRFDGCDAPSVRIKTVSGDVEGTLLTPKSFITHSASGSTEMPVSDPSAGTCTVNTVSGDVRVGVRGR